MTIVIDQFSRTSLAGWGSTPSGLGWQANGGTEDERRVLPGAARMSLPTNPGGVRSQTIPRAWGDGQILAHLRIGQVSETQALLIGLLFRRSAGGAFYRVRVMANVDGTISLSATRGVDQVGETVPTEVTYGAGSRVRVRARVDGHRLRARVWSGSAPEPSGWQLDRTVTANTIMVGDMGVALSAFAQNSNFGPWVDFERIEITYPLLAENTLVGPVGQQVTNPRLADSALAGTVTVRHPGTRAVYDDAEMVRGRPAIRLASGGHREETPHLRVALPATGAWSARWYAWMPNLQDAGHGTGEVRSVAVMPTHAWVVHGTAAANVGSRLHPPGLAAAGLVWDQETGSATALGQWIRVELRYAGGVFESRNFAGHNPAGYRGNVWNSLPDPGRTLDLTGYRWRRDRTLVQWGSSGAEVRALQNELLDLGYSLGAGGANGDFDERLHNLVMQVQRDLGVTPVDGSAGPETRSAIDLALGRVPPPIWISHLAIADGAWIGPAESDAAPAPVARLGFTVGIPI